MSGGRDWDSPDTLTPGKNGVIPQEIKRFVFYPVLVCWTFLFVLYVHSRLLEASEKWGK